MELFKPLLRQRSPPAPLPESRRALRRACSTRRGRARSPRRRWVDLPWIRLAPRAANSVDNLLCGFNDASQNAARRGAARGGRCRGHLVAMVFRLLQCRRWPGDHRRRLRRSRRQIRQSRGAPPIGAAAGTHRARGVKIGIEPQAIETSDQWIASSWPRRPHAAMRHVGTQCVLNRICTHFQPCSGLFQILPAFAVN